MHSPCGSPPRRCWGRCGRSTPVALSRGELPTCAICLCICPPHPNGVSEVQAELLHSGSLLCSTMARRRKASRATLLFKPHPNAHTPALPCRSRCICRCTAGTPPHLRSEEAQAAWAERSLALWKACRDPGWAAGGWDPAELMRMLPSRWVELGPRPLVAVPAGSWWWGWWAETRCVGNVGAGQGLRPCLRSLGRFQRATGLVTALPIMFFAPFPFAACMSLAGQLRRRRRSNAWRWMQQWPSRWRVRRQLKRLPIPRTEQRPAPSPLRQQRRHRQQSPRQRRQGLLLRQLGICCRGSPRRSREQCSRCLGAQGRQGWPHLWRWPGSPRRCTPCPAVGRPGRIQAQPGSLRRQPGRWHRRFVIRSSQCVQQLPRRAQSLQQPRQHLVQREEAAAWAWLQRQRPREWQWGRQGQR